MSSPFETLLEAARIIELEEQQRLTPAILVGRYNTTSHYNNNNNSNNNNNNNNSTNMNTSSNNRSNNTRLHQETSPPISPVYITSNGSIGDNSLFVGTGRQEYGGTILTAALARTNDGRNEEPYTNGHSLPTYLVIPAPSKQKNETQKCDLYSDDIAIEHYNNHVQNQTNYRLSSLVNSIIPETKLNNIKPQFIPLTPPPVTCSKLEITRTRSLSLSSNKITANGNGTVIHNGNVHNVLASATEDSSQSSLNLSSSGYLSGSSANSSVGGSSGSNLNMSSSNVSSTLVNGENPVSMLTQTIGRRRTTSTNSNGAGTREVHNKLEKHRRAHLKECFEQLKSQLQLKDEEKKKTSNLAILGAAYRHVMSLKRKERELEQQVEQLAKDKIISQKKILALKRELTAKYDHSDCAIIMSDGDIGNIPGERVTDNLSDSLSSGRGSTRYSSSSSLSSAATMSSPLGSSISLQTAMPTAMSPVISTVQSFSSPSSPHTKSTSPLGNLMPLSLTKNLSTSLMRGSPTPSTPSPSSVSSNNCTISSSPVVSSSSSSSSSPPIGIVSSVSLKMPNGVKYGPSISPSNLSLVTSTTNNHHQTPSAINFSTTSENMLTSTFLTTNNSGIPLNVNNTSQNVQILHTQKDSLSGKNGVCRKTSDIHDTTSSGMILAKDLKIDTNCDDSDQPTNKYLKLYNVNTLAAQGGIATIQIPPSVSFIGANGKLATIELSSSKVKPQVRTHQHQLTTPPTSSAISVTGAQLHQLLAGGGTTTAGMTTGVVSGVINAPITHTTELPRLPGGAELNILPSGMTMPRNGKLTFVNNGITLKSADGAGVAGRAVHVVTPIQSGGPSISGLTPIVNLSVGGRQLVSTQYLSSMSPMVVAVASNTTPTLASVQPPVTSVAVATANVNGSSL